MGDYTIFFLGMLSSLIIIAFTLLIARDTIIKGFVSSIQAVKLSREPKEAEDLCNVVNMYLDVIYTAQDVLKFIIQNKEYSNLSDDIINKAHELLSQSDTLMQRVHILNEQIKKDE